MLYRSVRASGFELTKPLPGDELIPDAIGSTTHAITIRCDRRALWPWLVQMGAGRAGWYSYDRVDNGRHQSSERIRPDLQSIAVGTLFPALPGVGDGYFVAACEPGRFLVLGWPLPDGTRLTTWAFVLDELGQGRTRLIVRSRASPAYHFADVLRKVLGLRPPESIARPFLLLGHFIMQRKQLLGIARRAEHSVEAPAGRLSIADRYDGGRAA
jgi:hypothetical protein